MYKNIAPPNKTNRIEYIDALRGFIMLLIVMIHVSNFCLESVYRIGTFHTLLFEFELPLFFFVSGFVFYKDMNWNIQITMSFIKKKIYALILTPIILMCIYLYINKTPILNGFCMDAKAGYWFTFMLFLYFCFYILMSLFVQGLHIQKYKHTVIGIAALGCYIGTSDAMLERLSLNDTLKGVLSISYWGLFLYFWFGTGVKEFFSQFQKLLDGKWLVPLVIALFLFLNIFPNLCPIHTLRIMICQLTGVVIVFAFFRHYQKSFTQQTKLGATLQYIGRRTLDIYFLHYFFLPVNLSKIIPCFSQTSIPAIEFAVSFFIAAIVITLCLIVGNVLRINPEMEHWMWGKKRLR